MGEDEDLRRRWMKGGWMAGYPRGARRFGFRRAMCGRVQSRSDSRLAKNRRRGEGGRMGDEEMGGESDGGDGDGGLGDGVGFGPEGVIQKRLCRRLDRRRCLWLLGLLVCSLNGAGLSGVDSEPEPQLQPRNFVGARRKKKSGSQVRAAASQLWQSRQAHKFEPPWHLTTLRSRYGTEKLLLRNSDLSGAPPAAQVTKDTSRHTNNQHGSQVPR